MKGIKEYENIIPAFKKYFPCMGVIIYIQAQWKKQKQY
jgi:hypothetical protein